MCSYCIVYRYLHLVVFFCQAEDGIRDLVRSRGLGDVYKRQHPGDAQQGLGGVRAPDPPVARRVGGEVRGRGTRDLSLIHI